MVKVQIEEIYKSGRRQINPKELYFSFYGKAVEYLKKDGYEYEEISDSDGCRLSKNIEEKEDGNTLYDMFGWKVTDDDITVCKIAHIEVINIIC